MNKFKLRFGKIKKLELFPIINITLLICISLTCILPFIHILAVSFSSKAPAAAGWVSLWPVDFTNKAYTIVLNRVEFWKAMFVSVQRVALGVSINMILVCLVAYPLSKSNKLLRSRTLYVWFFFITMIFNGGLIPTYMVVKQAGLIDNIFALILPRAVPIFSVIVLLNFFRQLPIEMDEAAFLDGAGHLTILTKIYLPLSLPAIATLILFAAVQHWNAWFDGMIFMNSPDKYPLQTYLRGIVIPLDYSSVDISELIEMEELSDRTLKAAQIFIGAVPILLVYPFLQKYFVKGLTIGGVKG